MDSATLGQSYCVLVALEEVVGEIGVPIRHRLAPSQEYEQKYMLDLESQEHCY